MGEIELKTKFAMSLRPSELSQFEDLDGRCRASGWKLRRWPADELRPGLRIYGFDGKARALTVLLEVTRGGAFEYRSRAEFERQTKRLLGDVDWNKDAYWADIPSAPPGKTYTGIALEWKVIERAFIPFEGNFDRLGWHKLGTSVISPVPETVEEGGTQLRAHLRRERSQKLRRIAIGYWRNRLKGRLHCLVCGFDFGHEYGRIGEGFAEMHHVIALASQDETREKRPDELVPLCANCHRMAHRCPPSFSIEDVRNARKAAAKHRKRARH